MSIAIFIFFLLLGLSVFISVREFQPTKFWWWRELGISKLFPEKFPDMHKKEIREIEFLLEYLINVTCSDENGEISQIRNGYYLRFFPVGANKNKRVWPFEYVEIHDYDAHVMLRVGFDEIGEAKYQLGYNHTDEAVRRMFYKSRQNEKYDIRNYIGTRDGKTFILNNYRDFLISDVL